MEPVKELFTATSIGTFAGASGAVWAISNVFRILVGRDSVILAFIIALIVAYVGGYAAKALTDPVAYFLVFLNGCLLFLTSAGVQGFASTALRGQPEGKAKLQGKDVKFFTPWFK